MELILLIGGPLLLDLLAMRYGVDSRALNLRQDRAWWPDTFNGDPQRDFATSHQIQLHYEAEVERIASLAGARQPYLRIRRVPRSNVGYAERAEWMRRANPGSRDAGLRGAPRIS